MLQKEILKCFLEVISVLPHLRDAKAKLDIVELFLIPLKKDIGSYKNLLIQYIFCKQFPRMG